MWVAGSKLHGPSPLASALQKAGVRSQSKESNPSTPIWKVGILDSKIKYSPQMKYFLNTAKNCLLELSKDTMFPLFFFLSSQFCKSSNQHEGFLSTFQLFHEFFSITFIKEFSYFSVYFSICVHRYTCVYMSVCITTLYAHSKFDLKSYAKFNYLKIILRSWRCSITCKAIAFNTGIPYGHQFEIQPLHFQPSSPPMHPGKQQKTAQRLVPMHQCRRS